MAIDLGMGVDTNVTPSLHPQVVASLESYDSETEGYLQPAVEAFKVAYEGIGKVHAARDAVRNDPTMTEAAQIVRTDDHAQKLYKIAAARFDKVTSDMQSGIAKMEAELSRPVEARAAHTIAVEIRSHAKAMDSSKLHAFIRQAIVQGDEVTVSSVLGAPPYLSGLTAEFQQTYTRMWHEKANPLAAKRIRAMQGALDLLGTNAPLITKELERAVGVAPFKVKQYREAKARADKAFAS